MDWQRFQSCSQYDCNLFIDLMRLRKTNNKQPERRDIALHDSIDIGEKEERRVGFRLRLDLRRECVDSSIEIMSNDLVEEDAYV